MGEVERNRRLRERAEHVKSYVLRQMTVPLLITMAVIVGLRYVLSMYNTGRVKLLPLDVMLLVIGISAFLGRAYSVGSKDELLQPTPIFQFVKRALGWRNRFVWPLVGTLVASALWEYVRSFFQAMFATPGLPK